MRKNDTDKPKKIKRYNVVKHQIWIISLMIVFVIILAFSLPWIIGVIELCFRNSKYWGYELIDDNGNLTDILNLSLLADFLGGLIGIIIGFLMELHFVEKLRILNHYQILLRGIGKELTKILDVFQARLREEKKEDRLCSFDIKILDDIVNDIDKESVFYNLPTISPNKKNRGQIHDKLHEIYANILAYNRLFEELKDNKISNIEKFYESNKDKLKNMTGHIIEFKIAVGKFIEMTGCEIDIKLLSLESDKDKKKVEKQDQQDNSLDTEQKERIEKEFERIMELLKA